MLEVTKISLGVELGDTTSRVQLIERVFGPVRQEAADLL